MKSKISILLFSILLSGCGANVKNIGSVHDDNIYGTTNSVLIISNLSLDTLSNQGGIIAENLQDKMKSCNIASYIYNPTSMSLNPNLDIDGMISEHKIDRVITLRNKDIIVDDYNSVLSQVITVKVSDVKSKRNIWMSEYRYRTPAWHFGGIWGRHDVKAAQVTTKNIMSGLEKDGIIGKCP
ncbi:hypothetical protein [Asaia astilbis]|uniref:hypothetical protein n=1 Tax=Asaia astilbis TaxID=610244 RepID=UPI0012EC926E|nr:hypothetical protein [Asaia astilbis]